MLSPSDLLVVGAVVAVIVWLDVPKLLLPALVLTLGAASVYRWRRDGSEPMAAARYRVRLFGSAMVIGAISIPLIFKIVPPNGVYGFRTSVTRSNVDIWYSANAFMGWALLASAVVSSAGLARLPESAKRGLLLVVFMLPLLAAVVASFVYLDRLA